MLWFDVGSERYTTRGVKRRKTCMLWFDVGSERYTTLKRGFKRPTRCGLM